MVSVFVQGSCYQLFLILRSLFPQAKCLYDFKNAHVYTDIDGVIYDIRGEFKGDTGVFEPMGKRMHRQARYWSRVWRAGELSANHKRAESQACCECSQHAVPDVFEHVLKDQDKNEGNPAA